MQLTAQQIQHIDATLVYNGLVYEDLKQEILDHIATDVETKMKNEKLDFEIAFTQSMELWKEQLRPSISNEIGFNRKPFIVIKKWKKIIVKQQWISFFLAVFLCSFLAKFIDLKENSILLNNVTQCIAAVYLFATIVLKVVIWQSKIKTSYGLVFSHKSNAIFVFLLIKSCGLFSISQTENSLLVTFCSFLAISFVLVFATYLFTLARKHFQFKKMLQIAI